MAEYSISGIKRIWILAILMLPLLILLPGLNGFAYPPVNTSYSDVTVTHYPNAIFLRSTLFEQHTIPLWSSTILSGYPFAANPLSGLWYPPGWLALALPLPLAFNLSVLFHLYLGGIGMWLLLRKEGLGELAALLGALAFESMPKIFAHYGAGHITLLYAISWTPWLLLFSGVKENDGFFNLSQSARKRLRFVLPGLVFALMILADVRWAAYAGILWWAYATVNRFWASRFDGIKRALIPLFIQTLLGVFLAAPLVLPLIEYTRLSTRAELGINDVTALSLPPARLLGLVYPTFKGFHEWVLYPSIIVLLLALSGLVWSGNRRTALFWWAVFFISLVLSLGSYVPRLSTLASLPGFDLLRVPSRMLFLTGFSLAALSAGSVDRMLKGLTQKEIHRSSLLLFSIVGFVVLFSTGVGVVTGSLPLSFAWAAGFALSGLIWIGIYFRGRIGPLIWFAGIIVLLLIDLGVVDTTLFAIRSKASVFAEAADEAQFISEQPGDFRVYSPSYSLPQHTAARYSIEMASGVDPLQLKSYADFMTKASGVPDSGYSVAAPPLEGEDPTTANAEYIPDPYLLGLLNVKYVLSGFALNVTGLNLVKQYPSTWLYQNAIVQPRVWIQTAGISGGSRSVAVKGDHSNPNRITLQADGPGLLVLSEVNYPGWRAWVDGQPADIHEVQSLLRSLTLMAGSHQVTLVFRPLSVYIGLGIFVVGLVVVLVFVWVRRR